MKIQKLILTLAFCAVSVVPAFAQQAGPQPKTASLTDDQVTISNLNVLGIEQMKLENTAPLPDSMSMKFSVKLNNKGTRDARIIDLKMTVFIVKDDRLLKESGSIPIFPDDNTKPQVTEVPPQNDDNFICLGKLYLKDFLINPGISSRELSIGLAKDAKDRKFIFDTMAPLFNLFNGSKEIRQHSRIVLRGTGKPGYLSESGAWAFQEDSILFDWWFAPSNNQELLMNAVNSAM